ncbi:CBL-interacting protein kinase 18-like protein [Drosera capensis]
MFGVLNLAEGSRFSLKTKITEFEMEHKLGVLLQRYDEMGRLLGQGTFAKVHHGRDIETGSSVAIKIIDIEKVFKDGMMEQIKREISVMHLIQHPNVVQLHEVMAIKTRIYFVMEYVKGGELFNKLISAVDYCHSRGVYQLDLKPENLLLDGNGNLKDTDFGLSALSETRRQDGKGYDGAKADIWSCGVILFVLLAGYLPFQDANLMEMYRKIGKAEFRFPNWFAPEVRRLLRKILNPNLNSRISAAKIMESSWFKTGYEKRSFEAGVPGTTPLVLDNDARALICLEYFEDKAQKKEYYGKAGLEEIAKGLKIKMKKKDAGVMKFEGSNDGRKGLLGFQAEIFEVTPTFHMVEMKKSSGDTSSIRHRLGMAG